MKCKTEFGTAFNVIFKCDHHACELCEGCGYTSDVYHAENFDIYEDVNENLYLVEKAGYRTIIFDNSDREDLRY